MKVYVDSREKQPWDFSFYNIESEVIKLDTGDYYFEDFPDVIIERKKTTGELAINLGKKWKQFEEEFDRMSKYKHPYIICEFPCDYLDIFPEKSGIPKNKLKNIRMNSGFLKYRLFQNVSKYNINVLFFNNSKEALEGVLDIIRNLK